MDKGEFHDLLRQMGVVSYRDGERLWDIAVRCAGTMGVAGAVSFAPVGAAAGTVTVPGLGAIPGWVAGALAGMVMGTYLCTAPNLALRDELQKLSNGL